MDFARALLLLPLHLLLTSEERRKKEKGETLNKIKKQAVRRQDRKIADHDPLEAFKRLLAVRPAERETPGREGSGAFISSFCVWLTAEF